jgi:hypothetical protein
MSKNGTRTGLADPSRMKPPTATATKLSKSSLKHPRGPQQYASDPDERTFALKKVLPAGMAFPYDFGFVPSTLADDGDPVDVLVLMSVLISMIASRTKIVCGKRPSHFVKRSADPLVRVGTSSREPYIGPRGFLGVVLQSFGQRQGADPRRKTPTRPTRLRVPEGRHGP